MASAMNRWRARLRDGRAAIPVVSVVICFALTVVLAATVGASLAGTTTLGEPEPSVVIDLTVDGETLYFTHEHGEPIDVQGLDLRIVVDGEPLVYQPPVPFFAATGFESGPTGPFNSASNAEWVVGESASLTLAGTNSPRFESGATVSVQFSRNGQPILQVATTVR